MKQLQHLTLDYLKIACTEGTCYGIIAVSGSGRWPRLLCIILLRIDKQWLGAPRMLCACAVSCYPRHCTFGRSRQ